MKSKISVCIQNLGMYNEGRLLFKWIELPTDIPFKEHLKDIQVEENTRYEEYMIADYECSFKEISIYDNFDALNELAKLLEPLTDEQMEILHVIANETGGEVDEETIESIEYVHVQEAGSVEEFGRNMFMDMYAFDNEAMEFVLDYIDYEKFGQSLIDNGQYVQENGKFYDVSEIL